MVLLALQVHILFSCKVEGNIMDEIEAIHILVMPEMIWPKSQIVMIEPLKVTIQI